MGGKLILGLVVVVLASPLAYGQLLNLVDVTGRVCCTPSGNCSAGSVGIPGVNVSLSCTTLLGTVSTLATGITNATGVFSLRANGLLPSLLSSVGGFIPCGVSLKLPLNSTICPILMAIPTLVTTLLTPLGTFRVPLMLNVTV